MHYSKIFVLHLLLYIYIYSNDEIEKEIRCCITKGEQTLFAQISCNNLIIMLIIGRTLIFLFAICSLSVRYLYKEILVLWAMAWQRKHLQIYSPLPQCMDRVIQYHSLSIAAELESYSYTSGLKVCHENKKISKNTGHGKNVWKNMRNFTRYI